MRLIETQATEEQRQIKILSVGRGGSGSDRFEPPSNVERRQAIRCVAPSE